VIVVDFKAVITGLALAKTLSVPLIYYCLEKPFLFLLFITALILV